VSADEGSWIYTAWVALVLAVLLPPLWVVLRLVADGSRARRLVRACARLVVRLTGCDVHLRGREHLEKAGRVMLVSNHASMADAAFLLAALPIDFQFIANHLHARSPILGLAIRRASYHVVDRGSWRGRAECGRAMVDALRGGGALLVFPEGTTPVDGKMLPFRNGAFRAAAKSGSRVVPLAIRGTRQMFPPSGKLRRGRIDIEILPALPTPADTRDGIVAARDTAVRAIAACLSGVP
jgi:1-acyl-sn-glycerol-3-phosphate acyltransferase